MADHQSHDRTTPRGAASAPCIVCLACGAAGALVIIAWLWSATRSDRQAGARVIDLLAGFEQAEKRAALPAGEAFAREEVVIEGDVRRAILAYPPTRLTFTVPIPARAMFRAAVALKPNAWLAEGDGVSFRVGISDDRFY